MRTGILIADLHIKAQDYMQTYNEYKFLEEYLENKTYDFCIILQWVRNLREKKFLIQNVFNLA